MLEKQGKTVTGSRVMSAFCALTGLIVFLSALFGSDGSQGSGCFDWPVLEQMASARTPVLTAFSAAVSSIADPGVLPVIVIAVAVFWVVLKREIWRPCLLVAAVAVAGGVSYVLKALTAVPRPPSAYMVAPFETDFSFPSGHVIGMAVALLVFAYLLYSRHGGKARLCVYLSVATIATGLVGFSRLYLGYHWITDVIASCGLALIVLAVAMGVDSSGCRRGWDRAIDSFVRPSRRLGGEAEGEGTRGIR